MGLKNPIGRALAENYVYVRDPEDAALIESLRAEVLFERSKEPVVKEVVKHVESAHNAELLEKYNAAMRELGKLKRPQVMLAAAPEAPVETKEERIVERIMVHEIVNHRLTAIVVTVAAIVSFVAGALIF